jgi:uncharacterized membrane protein YkoI
MKNLSRHLVLTITMLLVFSYAVISHAAESVSSKLASEAKITMADARAKALTVFPGKIINSELEHEHGGSGLRYSFDIQKGRQWREVGIDAKTGRILENSKESPNPKD